MELDGYHRWAWVTLSSGPAQLFLQPVSEPFWGTDLAEENNQLWGEGSLFLCFRWITSPALLVRRMCRRGGALTQGTKRLEAEVVQRVTKCLTTKPCLVTAKPCNIIKRWGATKGKPDKLLWKYAHIYIYIYSFFLNCGPDKITVFSDEVKNPSLVLSAFYRELDLLTEQGTLLPLVPSNTTESSFAWLWFRLCVSMTNPCLGIALLSLFFFNLKKVRKLEPLKVIILLGEGNLMEGHPILI